MAHRLWHRHPGVRSGTDLTAGERAADAMRNGMGSWPFVFASLLFLGAWMLFNESASKFDPYPFILLNLVLSCVAALQGAVLLIANKRSDGISAELAKHDYEVNQRALAEIQANTELTREIHRLSALLTSLAAGTSAASAPTDTTNNGSTSSGR